MRMVIETITAGWSETISLPNYNNVKPSLTLTARLAPGDDPMRVRDLLIGEARAVVQELADQALEDAGEPARYSTAPRYAVITYTPSGSYLFGADRPRVLAIVPANQVIAGTATIAGRHRIHVARALLAERCRDHPHATSVECLDDNLDRLAAAMQHVDAATAALLAELEAQRQTERRLLAVVAAADPDQD
jgi:hypothetical protein